MLLWPLVLALVAAGATSCDGDRGDAGGGDEPPVSTTTPPSSTLVAGALELTSETATVRAPVGASAARDGATVVVRVLTIENPAAQGLVLTVVVEDGDGERTPIGNVSPFPSDRPGTFRLPTPDGAARALAAGEASFVVTVEPADTTSTLDASVEVVLDLLLEGTP